MPLDPALGDAYRSIVVTTGTGSGGVPGTATAKEVDAQFNLDAGFGISLVTDPINNKVTIVNTGNGTGALTTITETNSNGTYYPIFTRPPPGTQTFAVVTDYVSATVPAGITEVYITGTTNDPGGVSPELRAALTGLIPGETFQGVKVSDSSTMNFTVAHAPVNIISPVSVSGNGSIATLTFADQSIAPFFSGQQIAISGFSITGFNNATAIVLTCTATSLTYSNANVGIDTGGTITPAHSNSLPCFYDSTAGYWRITVIAAYSMPETLSSITIATGAGELNPITGTYQMDTMYLDQTSNPLTYNPFSSTLTVSNFSGNTLTVDSIYSDTGDITGNLDVGTINKIVITSPATSATLTMIDGTIITLPSSTGTVALDNQQFYLGTTQIAINRSSSNISLSGITSIDGYAGGLAGGNSTTLLGSIPYQSDTNVTSLLSPNTTSTKKFLGQTGTGTNGAAPAWDTVTATDVGLGNVTNESKATMFTSPTFTGSVSISSGSISGLTTLAVRDTSAAFDVTLAATSSTTLTAGRSLTLDIANASRTVKLAGNIDIAGTLTTANAFSTSGNFALTLTTTNTTNATLPAGTVTLYGTGTGSITSNQLATSLSDETGSGSVVFGTNPTLASPAYGNSSSTTDADVTVDAAVTTFYAYVQSASTTTRTINISNLTAGRKVILYLRNTNVGAKSVNIAASTTTTGFVDVNLATSNGAASATSVSLLGGTGTAVVTVFNANGTFAGGM